MRATSIVAVVIVGCTCSAFAQDEIFSDDFESGVPFAWSSLSSWMPSVQIEPDLSGLTSQYVKPEDGATITATGSDSSQYELTIPPDALTKPVVIVMTPIAAIPNLPLTDGLGAGVELLPDGLIFAKPATLKITPFVALAPATAIGFAFHEGGAGFHLYPHLEGGGAVTFPVTGFSGFGFGFAGDLSSLSSITGMVEDSYVNAIAPPLRSIVQDLNAGSGPDPNDVAKIERELKDWHDDVVMEAANNVLACAGSCCPSMASQLEEAADRQLKWETVVGLLDSVADFTSNLETEFKNWESLAESFCDEVDSCDEACAAAGNICDSFDQINDLLEVQKTIDSFPGGWGFSCTYGAPAICQGLNDYRLDSVEMQCGEKIPVGGSTQIVAVPKSLFGTDVGKAHLRDPVGGSPIAWIAYDPTTAAISSATDELAVTVYGVEKGAALVGVALTQCERTVVGACPVEVGDPLRARIGACEWNSTSCHVPSLQGASTTVDVEALFDGAEPTDEIQVAVQPYRPLNEMEIAPIGGSCVQFAGDWGGTACAGVVAPGERFTVQIPDLDPEFPVFAVHVKAHFEGAEHEVVLWAYSTDICYSEADWWYDPDSGEISAPTAYGTVDYYSIGPGFSAPDSVEAEIGMLSATATCSPASYVELVVGWWDTVLMIPKDLRLFDGLLDTGGTLETPIDGAAFAVARAGECVDGVHWVQAAAWAGGWAETWSWEVIPGETQGFLGFNTSDSCVGEPWSETHELDLIVHPHLFGKPTRLVGFGRVICIINHVAPGYGHVSGSATWDVVNAATWEGDYVLLDDFRIFSCSGEFDINWPP